MKKTTDELVAEMLDREAIRDLPARYCDCVWRGDIDALVQLFTEDGAFVIKTAEGETRVQGRAALLDFYRVGLKHQQRPLIHNVVVDLKPKGRALGRCYVDLHTPDFVQVATGMGMAAETVDGVDAFVLRHGHGDAAVELVDQLAQRDQGRNQGQHPQQGQNGDGAQGVVSHMLAVGSLTGGPQVLPDGSRTPDKA